MYMYIYIYIYVYIYIYIYVYVYIYNTYIGRPDIWKKDKGYLYSF